MDITQWRKRLERTVADSTEFAHALSSLEAAEEKHKSEVFGKLFGYQAISNCFQAFAAATVSRVESEIREQIRTHGPRNYVVLLLRIAACFRTYRSANNAFLQGYPLPGCALLRNVKDWTIMLAGVGNGLTTLTAINGLEQPSETATITPPDLDRVRQRRIKEERRVLNVMLRTDASGLDDSVRNNLREWEGLFNMEVHAALGSIALEGVPWMCGQDVSPILHSSFSERPMLSFTNRAFEIGWMILKILPLLQVTPGQFGSAWAKTWETLDDSFRFFSTGLSAEGKPIGEAIVKLLQKKFDFNPKETCYAESMA